MTLEQLKQYRAWRISLQSLREELEQLRKESRQMEQTGVLEEEKKVQELLKQQELKLANWYKQKKQSMQEVEQWISELPGFKEAIFRLRYLDGLTWDQVANRTGYSEKQVFWIQRKTMQEDLHKSKATA